MPKYRPRAAIFRQLEKLVETRDRSAVIRDIILAGDSDCGSSGNDSNNDSIDDSIASDDFLEENLIDDLCKNALDDLSSRRYLFRENKYRNRRDVFDLEDCLSDESQRFNDDEFLIHFRVSRQLFRYLVGVLETSPLFSDIPKKRKKASVELHLLVFLCRMGSEGAEANRDKIATFLGIGKGSVDNYIDRVRKSLKLLKDKVIVWPDAEEKLRTKLRIRERYGFQRCIGIIDGTIIILNQKPIRYGDSYWCRKKCYSLNVQVICDDMCRILYIYGGWPGSVHDNRAWRSSIIYRKGSEYFADGEYLLGDSAYSACRFIVQSFKKLAGISQLSKQKEFFNTAIGRLRVKSEHCIGLLKNRFPCLRRINIRVEGADDLSEIMDLFECGAIIHNLCLKFDDEFPEEWYEENADSDHYWTNDYGGGVDLNTNGNPDYDRRDAVFEAYVDNYY